METKKVNFKNGDEIITISSIEDFIDIELAVLEDSFYSTPCGKYFRNKVNELETKLEESVKKMDLNAFLELKIDINDLVQKMRDMLNLFVLNGCECQKELQSKLDGINLNIRQKNEVVSSLTTKISELEENLQRNFNELDALIKSRSDVERNALMVINNEFQKHLTVVEDNKFNNMLLVVKAICKDAPEFTDTIIGVYNEIVRFLEEKKKLENQKELISGEILKEEEKQQVLNEKIKKADIFFNDNGRFDVPFIHLYLVDVLEIVNTFVSSTIPSILGRYYYTLMEKGTEENRELYFELLKLSMSTSVGTLICHSFFGNVVNKISDSVKMNPVEKAVYEYINLVDNWKNDPLVKEEDKEFIQKLACRMIDEQMYIASSDIRDKPYLRHTIWDDALSDGYSRRGKIHHYDLNIPIEYRAILDYLDEIRIRLYGFNYEKYEKKGLLLFDYAKAYLLYDLIVSNKITFINGNPPFVDEIKQRGKVRELKPVITTTKDIEAE